MNVSDGMIKNVSQLCFLEVDTMFKGKAIDVADLLRNTKIFINAYLCHEIDIYRHT